MLPKTLALIDDDHDYAQALSSHLQALGVRVEFFGDSNELLAHRDAFGFAFYVVDLMLPGVDGIALIDILRRRTNASVLVVSGRVATEAFEHAVNAGADMYLSKPVQLEQVVIAVKAVHRRAAASDAAQTAWRLDRSAGQLIAPDGARVELSAADVVVMECFLEANGDVVRRESLRQRLGRPEDTSADGVSGTVFRLRRRIERATPVTVPLQTKSGVGYVFRAVLKAL